MKLNRKVLLQAMVLGSVALTGLQANAFEQACASGSSDCVAYNGKEYPAKCVYYRADYYSGYLADGSWINAEYSKPYWQYLSQEGGFAWTIEMNRNMGGYRDSPADIGDLGEISNVADAATPGCWDGKVSDALATNRIQPGTVNEPNGLPFKFNYDFSCRTAAWDFYAGHWYWNWGGQHYGYDRASGNERCYISGSGLVYDPSKLGSMYAPMPEVINTGGFVIEQHYIPNIKNRLREAGASFVLTDQAGNELVTLVNDSESYWATAIQPTGSTDQFLVNASVPQGYQFLIVKQAPSAFISIKPVFVYGEPSSWTPAGMTAFLQETGESDSYSQYFFPRPFYEYSGVFDESYNQTFDIENGGTVIAANALTNYDTRMGWLVEAKDAAGTVTHTYFVKLSHTPRPGALTVNTSNFQN